MDVDRQFRETADLRGHLDDANAPAGKAADFGVRLDPADDILVGFRRRNGRGDIDAFRAVQLGIVMTLKAAHDIGGEKRDDARLRGLDDEMAKAGERHARRAALVDDRGHAGMHPDHVGVEPKTARHILVDMRMGVDQARQHKLARDVDDLVSGTRGNLVLDCGDHAVAHAYVPHAIDPRRRANDPAAAQDEIEVRCVAHRIARSLMIVSRSAYAQHASHWARPQPHADLA